MKDKAKKKKFYQRKRFWVVLFILLCVGGYFTYKFTIGKHNGKDKTIVERGDVEETLILSGSITADEYAQLKFPTSGDISWINVKEGETVKKGQALAKLDTTVLNTYFQQAKATLRAADATVENIHDQVKDNDSDETFAQKDTRTTAEAAKDRAYEAYVAAEYNLRNSTLIAPFNGIVSSVSHPYSGIFVLAAETQIELINPDTMYFDVSADQSEVQKLFVGQEVEILLDSLPDETLTGKVSFISFTPRVGDVGSIYKVRVNFGQEDLDIGKYRIGLSGDAKFVINKKEDVLWVPPSFVNIEDGKHYVQTTGNNGKVFIDVGLEAEDRTEISGGSLKEGDAVYD